MRIAIIGGGISGLSAAYELELARRTGVPVEYELFEAGSRFGGVISSEVVDGTVLEYGPDSFLTEKPAAEELCRELGLAGDLVGSNDGDRKTYILVRNRLVPLPDGLMFLVPTKLLPTLLTPLFSVGTKLRMILEMFQSQRPHGEDESVASLVKRHYGQQVVDRLADPLLSGIYGGNAEELSAQTVLPRMVKMEAKHGSLTLAMLAQMREQTQEREAEEEERPRLPVFTTLRFGLQQMIDGLLSRLDPERLHLGTPIQSIEKPDRGWIVRRNCADTASPEIFDGVIVATPAWAAAKMLGPVDSVLSEELQEIPYSSSIAVNLVFDGADLDPLPEGFGFLVPAAEQRSILACTFIHRKFPGRTASGKSVLRAFLGGVRNEALLAESDDILIETVREELRQILCVSAIPELAEVKRWPKAMAQYAVGHADRRHRIQSRLAALPTLYLAGNAYDGIGISDCIRLGRRAARELAEAANASTLTDSKRPGVPAKGQ